MSNQKNPSVKSVPVYMCTECEAIYTAMVSQCDCHFGKQEWIEGIATFPIKNMPRVHNKYHNTAPNDAVYVGRGSPYGNPFIMGKDGDRNEVCDKYEKMIQNNPDLIARVKRDLKGKDLICFCSPKRCHGDTLLRIANSESCINEQDN